MVTSVNAMSFQLAGNLEGRKEPYLLGPKTRTNGGGIYPLSYPLAGMAARERRWMTLEKKLNWIRGFGGNMGRSWTSLNVALVPGRGLEPPRCYPLAPEASASTNSATRAGKARRGNLRTGSGAVN